MNELLLRRRLMMQKYVEPEPGQDGRIWAWYNVTDTGNPTAILYRTNGVSNMLVDGVRVPVATTYQFGEAGEHLVRFTLSDKFSVPSYMFQNRTNLTKVVLPETITSISNNAFYGCSYLTDVNIPDGLTTIGSSSFTDCSRLTRLVFPPSITGAQSSTTFSAVGNTSGSLLKYFGSYSVFNTYFLGSPTRVYIGGEISCTNGYGIFGTNHGQAVHIGGNLSGTSAALRNGAMGFRFVELMGQNISTNGIMLGSSNFYLPSAVIVHYGYNGIAATPGQTGASYDRCTKIYVGPGESQAGDQAILDQYLADSNWAQYASKLDLWYNYDGEFKDESYWE